MTTPLSLYIGDDWPIPFALKDVDGNAIDLTGCTVGAVFWQANQAAPVLTLGVGTGVAMPTPSNGQFTITIPRTATSNVPPDASGSMNLPIAPAYGTRIQAFVTDASGVRTTRAIIPIKALDPRTAT